MVTRADPNDLGVASFSVRVPDLARGLPVVLQVVQPSTCMVSQIVAVVFE